jgi:branched-chain amino acid aminotransferase
MHPYILHNDEIQRAEELVLRAGQVGLLSGWGVFSTIRVCDGVLFAFERHFARMKRDAELMHVPFPQDSEGLKDGLLRLVAANEAVNATLRVAVVRNGGGMWEGPGNDRAYDIVALTTKLKEWGASVRLAVQPQARHAAGMFSGVKILSWAMNLTWLETAQQRGFDEVLLLNERGEVSECTSANVFASFGDEVRTPPLSSGCLPGVTREVIVHELHTPLRVVEQTLLPSDLEAADEVFITSTTRALLPVEEIEGLRLRKESRGCCSALNDALHDYVQAYVAEEKRSWGAARA